MSELSNLTRKQLEKYTVGLQNMNAEQREALADKEKELAKLRKKLTLTYCNLLNDVLDMCEVDDTYYKIFQPHLTKLHNFISTS